MRSAELENIGEAVDSDMLVIEKTWEVNFDAVEINRIGGRRLSECEGRKVGTEEALESDRSSEIVRRRGKTKAVRLTEESIAIVVKLS